MMYQFIQLFFQRILMLLGEALDDLMIKDRKVCIVTDSHVADFYLEQVEHIVKEHCAAASQFYFSGR